MAKKHLNNIISGISGGNDITRQHFGQDYLLPTERLIGYDPLRLDIFERVLDDSQVKSAWEKRQKTLIAKTWDVLPGDDSAIAQEAAELLKTQLTALNWNNVTEKMQHALFFGFAISELIYEIQNGKIIIKNILTRNQRRFLFNEQGEPLLRTRDHYQGMALPIKKFWHFNAGTHHDDEPYGQGLAHWLYWPVKFKREGLVSWLEFLEKFGSPFVVGKYEAGQTEKADQEKLLEACRAVQKSMGVAIPSSMMMEFVEAKTSGTQSYSDFIKLMDDAISKIIVGQTMTGDDGASLSQSQTHDKQQDMIVQADAMLIDGGFNAGPVKWWMEWNYGNNVAVPKVIRLFEDPDDKKQFAETVHTMKQAGWQAPQEQVDNVLGEGWEFNNNGSNIEYGGGIVKGGRDKAGGRTDTPAEKSRRTPLNNIDFSENTENRDIIDDITDDLDDAMDKHSDEMIEQIKTVLETADSFEEAQAALLKIYADIDRQKQADILGKAFALAHLNGYVEAG